MSGSNTICVATVLLETGHRRDATSPRRRCGSKRRPGVVEVPRACRDGRVESVELTNVPSLRRPARCGARGRRARHAHRRRRVRRHVVRDRRRARRSASRSSRTRRATSSRRRRARSARPRASSCRARIRERRDRRCLDRADRRAVAGVGARDEERRRRLARTARPLGDRHGPLRAHGDAARARADERRRRDDARVRRSARRSTAASSRRRRRRPPAIVPAIRGSAWITGTSASSTSTPTIRSPRATCSRTRGPGDDVQ